MNRKIIFLLLLFFNSYALFASPVNEKTAELVARNVYTERISELKNVNHAIELSKTFRVTASGKLLYYVFNIGHEQGFVIVSADDNLPPVLGYSFEGSYNEKDQHPAFREWMSSYQQQILEVLEKGLEGTEETKNAWEKYSSPYFHAQKIVASVKSVGATTATVGPLLSTKWNQGCHYNAMCPADAAGQCGKTYTGCNATAWAQVIKYHNFPSSGSGSFSYSSPYGTLTANFGSTIYDYASMPNSLSSSNLEVARLMYHCGVAVEMIYGPTVSNSFMNVTSFQKHFKYSLDASFVLKSTKTDDEFTSILRAEIDANRPMVYKGGEHIFVCDGYQSSGHFHFNWGWGGVYDGFFLLGNLNPGGNNFTGSQSAIINIKPAAPLEVSSYNVSFPTASAGSLPFRITSNSAWTISTSASWLTISQTSGTEVYSHSINISASSNPSYSSRVATVTLQNGTDTKTINVTQSGISPSLSVSPGTMSFGSAGGNNNLTINSDSVWTVSTTESWISLSAAGGTGNGSVEISALANGSVGSRSGIVTVKRGSLTTIVSVSQAASGSLWCIPVMTTPNSVGVTNVKFHTISRTSGFDEGYINTGLSTTIKLDSTYEFSTTIKGMVAIGVFIDWNADGDFSDAGEDIVGTSWYPSFDGNIKVRNVTVPSDAFKGNTRLRVYVKKFGTGPVYDPCADAEGGDIEDYSITITDNSMLTASVSSHEFTSSGGSRTVEVTANVNWEVIVSASWLSSDKSSGTGNGNFVLTASANATTSDRTTEVILKNGSLVRTISVTQQAAPIVLTTDQTSMSFSSSGGVADLLINSNHSWTVVTADSWISLSDESGNGDKVVNVTASFNPSTIARTGTIVVNSGSITREITVEQAPNILLSLSAINNTVNDVNPDALILYPNPGNGVFHIIAGKDMEVTEITIADVKGEVIFKEINGGSGKMTIDISDKPSGMYMLQVKNGNQVTNHRLVIF